MRVSEAEIDAHCAAFPGLGRMQAYYHLQARKELARRPSMWAYRANEQRTQIPA